MSDKKITNQTMTQKRQNFYILLEQKTNDLNKILNAKEQLTTEILNINGRIQMLNELISEKEIKGENKENITNN